MLVDCFNLVPQTDNWPRGYSWLDIRSSRSSRVLFLAAITPDGNSVRANAPFRRAMLHTEATHLPTTEGKTSFSSLSGCQGQGGARAQ